MRVIEEHPCDLTQPYDQLEQVIDWIHEERDLHIFTHRFHPSSVFIWFTYRGEGIQMHKEDWSYLEQLLDV